MRRVFTLLLAVSFSLLAGCTKDPSPDFVPVAQQAAMTQMVVAGGYDVMSTPDYEGTRWAISARVHGCAAVVKLVGNEAPKSESPTSYTIVNITGIDFSRLSPADSKNMPAVTLKGLPGISAKLHCAQE